MPKSCLRHLSLLVLDLAQSSLPDSLVTKHCAVFPLENTEMFLSIIKSKKKLGGGGTATRSFHFHTQNELTGNV